MQPQESLREMGGHERNGHLTWQPVDPDQVLRDILDAAREVLRQWHLNNQEAFVVGLAQLERALQTFDVVQKPEDWWKME